MLKFGGLKTITALVFCFLGSHLWAQAPVYQSVNVQSGAVYSMVQDANGYLWLGTEKGLVCYDGLHFKKYSSGNGSLSDLWLGNDGALHCQSFSGNHYILKNDSLQSNTKLPGIGKYAPIINAADGTSYFVGYNQVYRHNKETDTLQFRSEVYGVFKFQNSMFAFDSTAIYPLGKNAPLVKHSLTLKGETVFFTATLHGKLLVFPRNLKNGKAYTFLPEPQQLSIDLPEVLIQSVNVVYDSLVFISTNNGLYVLDKELKRLLIRQPLLYNKSVSGVLSDAEGNIWASTLDNGLFKFSCFQCVTTPTDEPALSLSNVQPDGGVLFGTTTGKVYKWKLNGEAELLFESKRREQIVALYRDAQEHLLVAGDMFTIYRGLGKTSYVPLAVKKIAALGNNGFALARTGGVSFLRVGKVEKGKKSYANLFETPDWRVYDRYAINNGNLRVRAVAYDSLNHLVYAVTSIGLLQLKEEQWEPIKIGSEAITATDLVVKNDTLFVLSANKVYLIKKGKILYEKIVGTTTEAFTSIRVSNKAVWLSAGANIYRYDALLKSNAVYELTAGLEVNDFTVTNERLLIATDAGITAVLLNDLPENKPFLKLHIKQFTAANKVLNVSAQNKLSHADNNLKLLFSVPYFATAENLQLQYRIGNTNWQLLENGQRELNLISLEPDNYVLQLQAVSKDGRKSEIEQVSFVIQPPFFKTWWFYVLSLLAVASVAYVLYRYRLNLVQKQNALEKQKIELENKLRESILASVKAQMNPHFIFNALNTIQSFIYLNDKKNATGYLGKFSQLTRTILEMSNKTTVSLAEEIEAILLYLELEKMRFDEGMNYSIEVSSTLDKTLVRIPSMIIQPYIENAVKHGLLHKKGERSLKCSFEMQAQFLKVTIDDNGIGRTRSAELNKIKNKEHQSFATQANEKRLEALNRGTAVTVSVQYTDKISPESEALGTTVVLLIAVENIE